MTTPEVHEIRNHVEPSGAEGTANMHAGFEDQLPPKTFEDVRAARLAGLKALQNANVMVVRPGDIQKIQSDAVAHAQSSIPKEQMH